ncbi:MAG: type IV pilin N-terminal domain-containing protein [Methanosarcina sp.]|uniref:type IV pilin N-terminal domain-containing protein n=1 Tax=Methanosarcina sp. TaxID=2213 RepID=UPI00262F8482|nr:type IV pilin N-terminal domain-containing protein [Methanosarcina sp.]MDD3245826.1 type IV pilin N-terminal domain-containing protein [Methanosarcina sp.]MDD4249253.1 type IV pilin N-terminal domain-containing protein [Methanosarcina sp.]
MYFQGVFILVFEKLKRNSSGVSSVLGEVLIAGVFVLSLGSLFVFVNSIDTPVDSAHLAVEEWIDTSSDTIYLHHVGGEPIDTKDLKINVNIRGTNHMYPSANISENLGGKSFWDLSDVIEINTSEEWGISILNEKDVTVKLINSDSREIINPKYRVCLNPESPAPSIDFDIAGKSVVPNGAFISGFTVLGAAITNGAGGDDLMVTTRLKVGNDTFDPWGDYNLAVTGNVNDHTTHSWNLPATYPAGTPVSISGKSWNLIKSPNSLDSSWAERIEVSSMDDSEYLIVLRNGDAVPQIKGFSDQNSITDFVDAYVEDDKIVLEENEVIFLFELGNGPLTDPSSDFQDLVILMEIDSAPA